MKLPSDAAFLCMLREDFGFFTRVMFNQVYKPNTQFLDNWHHHAMEHALMEAYQGIHRRLIINIGPRSLKSYTASIALPAFMLGRDPEANVICVSYAADLGRDFSLEFRKIVESPLFRKVFPNFKLRKVTSSEIVTAQGGRRISTSVGGVLTGRGADVLIIDDPIKPGDAQSDTVRNSVNQWFSTTLFSRLDDKEFGSIILAMQRVHAFDLTGHLQNSGFRQLCLPAIALRNESIPIGANKLHHRKIGDVLNPQRESLATLNEVRNQMGTANFNAQYQQRPDAPNGDFFKASYLPVVSEVPRSLLRYGTWWLSIDAAASTAETADFSALTLGCTADDLSESCIVHVERGRYDYETLVKRSLLFLGRFPKLTFIIEAASAGISLIQTLRNLNHPVHWHHAKGDKMSRAARVLPFFERGQISTLRKAGEDQWVDDFLNEMLSFPNGRYDDQVDSVVQALRWALRYARVTMD